MTAMILAAASNAGAAPVGIVSYDNGWYSNLGAHSAGNTSNFTGYTVTGGSFPQQTENRSFYAFDLAGLDASFRASSISITFFARGTFTTDTGSESIALYDYTADTVARLVAGSTATNAFGDNVFADLGKGLLGTHTVTAANGTTMQEFTVELSSAFLDQFHLALLGEQKIALGAALQTGSHGMPQGLWGGFGALGVAQLNITEAVADPAQIPLPSTLLLGGIGLLGMGLRRGRAQRLR